MADAFWMVAKTKPRQERWAAKNVERQGFEYYLPATQVTVVKRGRKVVQPQYLFPRYLFVRTTGRWRSLLGTFGVTELIMQGDSPAVMPCREIEQLRAREDEDGNIVLPTQKCPKFVQGDTIRVTEGPYKGFMGIVDGLAPHDRVKILLEFLGRHCRVLVPDGAVEKPND